MSPAQPRHQAPDARSWEYADGFVAPSPALQEAREAARADQWEVLGNGATALMTFLARTVLDPARAASHIVANRRVGVPYTDEMVQQAAADLQAQASPDADTAALLRRYPKTGVRNFDGQPQLTEMDALVSYLQVLGTLAEFDWRRPDPAMLR